MSKEEIKTWFDRAYASIAAGDFSTATTAFEYIISNFDAYAAGIAQQRLRWYCIPLKTVFDTVQESQLPVNIHEVMAAIFHVDHHSSEVTLQRTFQEIEKGLSTISDCVRVGEKYWISKYQFEELIRYAVRHIQDNSGLVQLARLIETRWVDSNFEEPNLPDYVTEDVFAEKLAQYEIHSLAHGQFFISNLAVSEAVESFHKFLQIHQTPIRLRKFLAEHFSTDIYLNELEVFFKGRLDARFLELAPGFEFSVELIKLDAIPLDQYFQESFMPLSTSELLVQIFFKDTDQLAKLSPKFIKLATKQLSRNNNLYHLPSDQWILSSPIQKLFNQIIDYLTQQELPLSAKAILENLQTVDSRDHKNFALLASILESRLRESQIVVDTGNSRWLHRDVLEKTGDKVYAYLLDAKQPQSTNALLQQLFKLSQYSFSNSFSALFEKMLVADGRFSNQSINRLTYWQHIDPSYQRNQKFQQILTQRQTPLTLDELLSLTSNGSQSDLSEVDLSMDNRFKSFPGGLWGLSRWVWLNDLAFNYIAMTRQYYHRNVIVGLLCQHHKISQHDAVFNPHEDSRFVKDSINRWGIIYRLSPEEIDRVHTELIKKMGLGCSIDNILKYITKLPPYMTDAEEVLSEDSRFISIEGKWFARESAYYELSESDRNQIHDFMVSLSSSELPISLGILTQETLGRDARLTNAEEQLQSDERFQEVFEGFWVFTGFKLPDIDRPRSASVGIRVKSDRAPLGKNDDVGLLSGLTLRKDPLQLEKATSTSPIKKAYITLTHMDILHGNLRISGILKQLVPYNADAIHFEDDQNNEFLCRLDETRSILYIRPWLEKRGLTFGDKISIQPGRHDKLLFIRSYGERDQRVFHEAIQHQNVERLIEEARQIGTSYHDLMIEVMEALNVPLHREDIFQLVDYQRTATRNTIFEILSLVDCPYEELRYFVPVERGYWVFDRKRKEAYDMKMQELIQQNSALKGDVAMLTNRLETQKHLIEQERSQEVDHQLSVLNQRISQVEAERDEISKSNEELKAQVNQQTIREDQLSSQLELLESDNCILEEHVAKLETQKKELLLTIDELTSIKGQISQIEVERDAMVQANGQLSSEMDRERIRGDQLASQLELLQSQHRNQEEHLAQLEIREKELVLKTNQLIVENSNLQETLREFRQNELTSKTLTEELQTELSKKSDEKANLQTEIAALIKKIGEVEAEHPKQLTHLHEQLEANREALNRIERELDQARDQAKNSTLSAVKVQNELSAYKQQLEQITRALGTPLGKFFSRILRIS